MRLFLIFDVKFHSVLQQVVSQFELAFEIHKKFDKYRKFVVNQGLAFFKQLSVIFFFCFVDYIADVLRFNKKFFEGEFAGTWLFLSFYQLALFFARGWRM